MSNYVIINGELYHHGVKGMKWGVRRYQKKDGSLTPAGKRHYSRMSDDKLQKALYKQVKDVRSAQSDWSNKWRVDNTIGKHSKAAQDKFEKDLKEHQNTDTYKKAMKRFEELEQEFESPDADYDKLVDEWNAVAETIYRPELNRAVFTTRQGRQYCQEYLDKYGKDLNIGYLKDLGYNDSVAKEFTERILKADKKLLNGM